MESEAIKSGETLDELETHAIQSLDSEVREHTSLSQRLFNMIGIVVARTLPSRSDEVTDARKVATLLLLRLREDLRRVSQP
jgi:hypothetical protein